MVTPNLIKELALLCKLAALSSQTKPPETKNPPELESTGVTSSNLVGISFSEVLVMMDPGGEKSGYAFYVAHNIETSIILPKYWHREVSVR